MKKIVFDALNYSQYTHLAKMNSKKKKKTIQICVIDENQFTSRKLNNQSESKHLYIGSVACRQVSIKKKNSWRVAVFLDHPCKHASGVGLM